MNKKYWTYFSSFLRETKFIPLGNEEETGRTQREESSRSVSSAKQLNHKAK